MTNSVVSTYDIPNTGLFVDMYLSGNTLIIVYSSDDSLTFHVLDVSDRTSPILRYSYHVTGFEIVAAEMNQNNRLYLVIAGQSKYSPVPWFSQGDDIRFIPGFFPDRSQET